MLECVSLYSISISRFFFGKLLHCYIYFYHPRKNWYLCSLISLQLFFSFLFLLIMLLIIDHINLQSHKDPKHLLIFLSIYHIRWRHFFFLHSDSENLNLKEELVITFSFFAKIFSMAGIDSFCFYQKKLNKFRYSDEDKF